MPEEKHTPSQKDKNTSAESSDSDSSFSRLEKRERELYQPDRPTAPDVQPTRAEIGPTESIEEEPESTGDLSSFTTRQLTLAFSIVIGIGLVLVAFIFWRGFFAFSTTRVVIDIQAPEEAEAGEEVTWQVRVTNNNRSAIEAGELVFFFPEHSLDETRQERKVREGHTFGSLAPGEQVSYEFEAVVMGGENSARTARAAARFQPEGSSIIFENVSEHRTIITRFPISLALSGPQETLSGERVLFEAVLTNEGERAFHDMRVRLEYPSTFSVIETSDTLENSDTLWNIGTTRPDEERELTISGEVRGSPGEGKVLRAFVEYQYAGQWHMYREVAFRTDLAIPPLDLDVRLSRPTHSEVTRGTNLTYVLNWRNSFDAPLSRLILATELDSVMFDRATIGVDGAIREAGRIVEWSEAHHPSLGTLRPGESGSVELRVRLTNAFPGGIVNPTAVLRSVIESETRPEGLTVERVRAEHTHEIRITGEAVPVVNARYTDAQFSNTGPYPLQVGERTTFTIRWQVRAFANGMEDVTMRAIVPSGIEWVGERAVPIGELEYNRFSREVVWRIPELSANHGVTTPAAEAVFQIEAHPSPVHQGRNMQLLSETEVRATDTFTDVRLDAVTSAVDSSISDDPASFSGSGRVE